METLIGRAPDGWVERPLGELCEVAAGPSGAAVQRADSATVGTPMVVPKCIQNNRISPEGLHYVAANALSDEARYSLAADDVVCVRTVDPGRHAPVTEEQAGWLFGTACLRIRPRSELVVGSYLSCYMEQPAVQDWIDRISSGSVVHSLRVRDLERLPVVLPPRDWQLQVISVVSALDTKIELHNRISRTTIRQRELLLSLLVVGSPPDLTLD